MLKLGLLGTLSGFSRLRPIFTSNLRRAHRLTLSEKPDLVLLDAAPGFELTAVEPFLAAPGAARVALWVEAMTRETAVEALRLGVSAVLDKTLPGDVLLSRLEGLMNGWIESEISARAFEPGSGSLALLGSVLPARA